jgi:MFS family permease
MRRALAFVSGRTFFSLRTRNYRLFFTAQGISNIGTWMHLTALAWLILDLTGSAVAVGVLVLCRTLPHTILGLVSGVIADRVDNRRMIVGTTVVIMLTVAMLAALSLAGSIQAWQVYLLTAVASTAGAFALPNRQTFVVQMVGRDALSNAVALNSSVQNSARAIGPALGGVLIAAAGVSWCFVVNALSFVPVLAALLAMRTAELMPLERKARPTVFRGIAEGVAYARSDRLVAIPLGMILVVGALGSNFHVLLPVLASERLQTSPAEFGVIFSVFGIGALVGSLAQASVALTTGRMVAACAGFSAAYLLLVPASTLAAAAVLVFVAGTCFTIWTSSNQAMLQLAAPDHLRGRVISLYLFAFTGIAPIGALLSGWLAEAGGVELAFAVAGTSGLLASAVTLVLLRRSPAGSALPSTDAAAGSQPVAP